MHEELRGTSVRVSVVSEAGASVYSVSEGARGAEGGLDIHTIGAASLARRLQDPLAELVKLDPKTIGVGMYQHDVAEKAYRFCGTEPTTLTSTCTGLEGQACPQSRLACCRFLDLSRISRIPLRAQAASGARCGSRKLRVHRRRRCQHGERRVAVESAGAKRGARGGDRDGQAIRMPRGAAQGQARRGWEGGMAHASLHSDMLPLIRRARAF